MDVLVGKIARIVRFHRKKAKMTQLELAKLSGIGKTAVFDIEKGKKTVRLASLLSIFHALNITVEFRGPLMHRFEEYEPATLQKLDLSELNQANSLMPCQKELVAPFRNEKKAKVFVDGILAGHLIEWKKNQRYEFSYLEGYSHQAISLTMPLSNRTYWFDQFPPFFDGFLPEGFMLDALLRKAKLDSSDRFEQLMRVGGELVGNITVERDLS